MYTSFKLQSTLWFGSIAAATLLLACDETKNSNQGDTTQSTTPIPSFPKNGIPDPVGTSGKPTEQTTRSAPATTTPEGGASTTTALDTRNRTTTQNPTTTDVSSTSSTSSSSKETTSESPLEPGEARFVDLAHFIMQKFDDGSVRKCLKYEHQRYRGVHQFARLGNDRFADPKAHNGRGNQTRNVYFVFDTSMLEKARKAHIEFYLMASNKDNAGAGDFVSIDAEETVVIHSIDRYSPNDLINAAFGDSEKRRAKNEDMFNDLQDGTLYGSFAMSLSLLAESEISPAPTNPVADMDCSESNSHRTCGRWIRIELNDAAVKDINESKGQWAMGWSLGTRDYFDFTEEDARKRFGDRAPLFFTTRLFFGAYIDKSFGGTRRPKPRLITSP